VTNLRVFAALAAAMAVWIGCTCTEEEVESVHVTVVDVHGDVVIDAAVRYLVASSDDPEFQDCEFSDHSDRWDCGWEASGAIDIEVSADGFEAVLTDVFVDRDFCHVITEDVTVVLEEIP